MSLDNKGPVTFEELEKSLEEIGDFFESEEYAIFTAKYLSRLAEVPGLREYGELGINVKCLNCRLEKNTKYTKEEIFLGCDRCWKFECMSSEIHDEVFKNCTWGK